MQHHQYYHKVMNANKSFLCVFDMNYEFLLGIRFSTFLFWFMLLVQNLKKKLTQTIYVLFNFPLQGGNVCFLCHVVKVKAVLWLYFGESNFLFYMRYILVIVSLQILNRERQKAVKRCKFTLFIDNVQQVSFKLEIYIFCTMQMKNHFISELVR